MSTNPIPREILEAPFPPELVKTRPGAYGNNLCYVEGHSVISRLNEAFEGGWSFEIVEHQILEEEVLVLGKLRAEGFDVAKMAFGSSRITRDKNGNATAIGDDLKAATTDALKKSATLLGVGLQLYGSNGSTLEAEEPGPVQQSTRMVPQNGNGHRQVVPFRGNGSQPTSQVTNGGNGNNGDSGNNETGLGRVTPKQLAAIFAIARDRRMSNNDVREMCKNLFNRLPDYLTKAEASALIEHLLAQ